MLILQLSNISLRNIYHRGVNAYFDNAPKLIAIITMKISNLYLLLIILSRLGMVYILFLQILLLFCCIIVLNYIYIYIDSQ